MPNSKGGGFIIELAKDFMELALEYGCSISQPTQSVNFDPPPWAAFKLDI